MIKILTKKLSAFLVIFSLSAGIFLSLPSNVKGDYQPDSDVPIILPRSTWDNTSSLNALMTWWPQNTEYPPDWQSVERIVVHDTGCDPATNATCNNNIDPIPTIQAIYRYHAVTRGWGDIGYNYIIDQQGRIYEGRYGGNGSRGAHAYYDRAKDNFNYGSIGISILGNYATIKPPPAALDSLARLAGWLAAENNLNPPAITSSFIWNADKGGFKTLYTGPVVVGHKDIEPGNPDPANINFSQLRADAGVFTAKFKDYIYQSSAGGAKIYKIQAGKRQIFDDLAVYLAQGGTYSKLISLSQTQLDLFSEGRFFKYPDGSLLQVAGNPMIYLIENAKKRALSVDAKQFVKLDFDFNFVKGASVEDLANFADGQPIKYGPDKSLISDGLKVYLIENGKKRWVTSGNLFNFLKFKWSNVKNLGASADSFLDGVSLTYPDGTLLKEQSKETVYLIKDGAKQQIFSAQSFIKNGFKWEKIIIVDSIEISLYPAGGFVPYPAGTILRPQSNPSVYVVSKTQLKPFISAEIFLNLKYKWSQVLVISDEEANHYAIGEPIKYPEGALLRPKDENNVYLISEGALVAIDGATFKKKKYKWANVLVVSPQDFANLYMTQKSTQIQTQNPTQTVTPTPTPTPSPTPLPTPTPSPVVAQPKMRVAIFEVITPTVTLTANTAYDILDKSGQIMATKNANEQYVYTIPSPNTSTFAKIVPKAADGIVEVVSYEDRPAWKPTLNYNKYHGAFEIVYSAKSNKIWGVNELYLEDYLKGMAETAQGDPTEYLRTMVVAARSYAYYYILLGGKRGVDEVYILNSSSGDQVYKGYAREIISSDISAAVNYTFGQIASFNNLPIIAAYSSGASDLLTIGSKSACSVWGGKFCQSEYAYLNGGVKDPEGTIYTNTNACGLGGNHCVGLSGAGTRQFAKTGTKNYQEILKYYYPGAVITKIY